MDGGVMAKKSVSLSVGRSEKLSVKQGAGLTAKDFKQSAKTAKKK
jgi:hypothetical protein